MSITLAEILRIKAEKGYSVSKLSEYSGVPVETLRKILAGNTTDTMEADLAALENALFQSSMITSTKSCTATTSCRQTRRPCW